VNYIAPTCPQNQWGSRAFHRHVDAALKEEQPDFGLTAEEMRSLYLMMWLQLGEPAGNG
jgi:hypothetical protein